MLQHQQTAAATTDHCQSLIDSILHLRRQLGIDIPLSMSDPQDTSPSPIEMHEATGTRRYWLAWEQSPCAGKRPEKD
jgi:hypothetical protein